MSRINFQKAELSDLPELFSAGKIIFRGNNIAAEKWDPENISEIFMDDTSLMIIALRDKKIFGIAIGKISDNENRIMEMIQFGVLDKFSGTGLDEELLTAFNNAARESGIKSVRIKNISNRANKLFIKTGFVETETIRVLDLKI